MKNQIVLILLISLISFIFSTSPFAIISTPFAVNSKTFEVLKWNDNEFNVVNKFTMEKSNEGDIIFLSNGKYGIVSQDKGSLGIFKVSSDGTPVIMNSNFKMKNCYSNSLVLDPVNNNRIYVLDENTDGGICILSINFDTDEIIDEGLFMKLANPLNMLFPNNMIDNAIVISLSGIGSFINIKSKTILDSIIIFNTTNRDGTPDALVSSSTITSDHKYILVLDNNIFGGSSRFGVVSINSNTLKLNTTQILSDKINDPSSIISSPYNNDVLITSCQGNAIILYSYDSTNQVNPYIYKGPKLLNGSKPQLPTNFHSMLGDNAIKGRIYLSEVSGIRQIQFNADFDIIDLGLTSTSDSNDGIIGSYGIQPSN